MKFRVKIFNSATCTMRQSALCYGLFGLDNNTASWCLSEIDMDYTDVVPTEESSRDMRNDLQRATRQRRWLDNG